MATLAELRAYVRRQTETTTAELPNVTVDGYLRDAFLRTVNAEVDWPFYEEIWQLTLPERTETLDVPTELNRSGIVSLTISEGANTRRLSQIDQANAEELYLMNRPIAPRTSEFSMWGDKIYLWPAVTYPHDVTLYLRGYRLPRTLWLNSETESPDADPRLHWPMAHYAVALAYAQQEDMELENQYMQRWQRDAEMARQAIMEPHHRLPLRMGGGLREVRRIFR